MGYIELIMCQYIYIYIYIYIYKQTHAMYEVVSFVYEVYVINLISFGIRRCK